MLENFEIISVILDNQIYSCLQLPVRSCEVSSPSHDAWALQINVWWAVCHLNYVGFFGAFKFFLKGAAAPSLL